MCGYSTCLWRDRDRERRTRNIVDDDEGLNPHITRRIVAVRVSKIRMQNFTSLELLGTLFQLITVVPPLLNRMY